MFSSASHIITSVVDFDDLRSVIPMLRMSKCQPPSPQRQNRNSIILLSLEQRSTHFSNLCSVEFIYL